MTCGPSRPVKPKKVIDFVGSAKKSETIVNAVCLHNQLAELSR